LHYNNAGLYQAVFSIESTATKMPTQVTFTQEMLGLKAARTGFIAPIHR
jgi:hypothetical protein